MTKLSQLGPPIVGRRHGDRPKDAGDHIYTCPTCGQPVDQRDLRQVIWHNQPGHEPLET
ncbi:hypothetical protein [Mesorhizobium kowhaii]|uniref:C2H2-type domain-containing protein n=1 Tax=Mesorhizobium kowhaii TaxID=1300272 RepID=A0A2W7C090_9HYPH|nr:hypothetical protein [Mesorhizobium kowhaii]PZV36317.1 hypothetical protein B5V02_24405 [Mesorhizobium kowhaii]